MSSFATLEGTDRYKNRFELAEDFYSKTEDLYISSLGVGSYIGEPYKEENYSFSFKEAIKEAILLGVNLIDTAINYRYTKSEKEIGEALSELINSGFLNRDEVVVCSKGGFIELSYPFPENPYHWIRDNIIKPNLAKDKDIALDQHCISVDYIKHSFFKSLNNLNLDAIDIYYLHNPETQLGYISYSELMQKIGDIFIAFEELIADKKLKYYGVATWNAFSYEPTNFEYIKIKDLVDIANSITPNHHFKFLQMPYNLAKPHAYNYSNQQDEELFYTPIQIAKKYNLNVITSSALLQMNLFKRAFSKTIHQKLGIKNATDIQAALQFARSAKGVSSSLFSSKDLTHIRENLDLRFVKKTISNSYESIFQGDGK